MIYVVDRIEIIEEEYEQNIKIAVLQDDNENIINVNINDLPESIKDNLKESDVLIFEDNIWRIDYDLTVQKNKNLSEKLKKLFSN